MGGHQENNMRIWLGRVLLVMLGCLLTIAGIWGVRAYRLNVFYAHMGDYHAQPSASGIAELGKGAIPDLCMEIADSWSSQPDVGSIRMASWCSALAQIGDPRAVPTLIALTDHRDSNVRLWAVLALRNLKDPRSLPALTRLGSDKDHRVAEEARAARRDLSSFGGRRRRTEP